MSPPNRGPSVGPIRGPRRYHPKMSALLPGSNMSERLPPPLATPTDPKNPDNVLMAMSVSMLGLRADGICRSVKIVKQDRYIGRRPNVSLNGALGLISEGQRYCGRVYIPLSMARVRA